MNIRDELKGVELAISRLAGNSMSENVMDFNGEPANLVDALAMIAHQLNYLGNGNASTPMGALEAHGKAIDDASHRIASSLDGIASSLDNIAIAIERE